MGQMNKVNGRMTVIKYNGMTKMTGRSGGEGVEDPPSHIKKKYFQIWGCMMADGKNVDKKVS